VPARARALLKTLSELEREIAIVIKARVPGGGAEAFRWLVDSLTRAVARRRAFAIVFDETAV